MNTKQIGDISEHMVLAHLLRVGKTVLKPVGDNQRYDLVIDNKDGTFSRVQVKTGRLQEGAIRVPVASSSVHRGGRTRGYAGEIEFFGVYCPELDRTYLVPIAECEGCAQIMQLRVKKPKNGQTKGLRPAKRFEILPRD